MYGLFIYLEINIQEYSAADIMVGVNWAWPGETHHHVQTFPVTADEETMHSHQNGERLLGYWAPLAR